MLLEVVGFVCLFVESGLMDVVIPGMSMALSGNGGRGLPGWREIFLSAFLVLHLSLGMIVNLCMCVNKSLFV